MTNRQLMEQKKCKIKKQRLNELSYFCKIFTANCNIKSEQGVVRHLSQGEGVKVSG